MLPLRAALACALLFPAALPAGGILEALGTFQTKLTNASAATTNSSQPARNLQQLKTLEMLIKRGDYEKAQRALQSLGYFEVPPDLQSDWLDLVEAITAELANAEQEAMEQWRADVSELGKTATAACIEATEPGDLDAALVACAALQMNRRGQDNVLGQVVSQRLTGIAQTLEMWSRYLEFRVAENAKAANEVLANLARSQSGYPVLSVSQIEAAYLPEPPVESNDAQELVSHALRELDSLEGLSAAISRVEEIGKNPRVRSNSWIAPTKERLSQLQKASEAVSAGQFDAALRLAEWRGGGLHNVQPVFDSLTAQIVGIAVDGEIQQMTGLAREPNEDTAAFVDRALTEFAAATDYASMIDLMALTESLPRDSSRHLNELREARSAIEQFLAAQRFEKAGDNFSAISAYRAVIGSDAPFVPVDAATAAFARLKEQTPDLVDNPSAQLIEEIQKLRSLIQMQQRRSGPGMPPGFR